MKVYKLEGKTRCAECGETAELYLDALDIALCKKCGVKLYKELGIHFVPRAVPNVILRSEKQDAPLSHLLYKDKDEKGADKGKVEDNRAKDNHPTKGNLTKDNHSKDERAKIKASTPKPAISITPAPGKCIILNNAPTIATAAPNP